ncbi:MAG: hypothetical protein KW804_02495 [Candidatus Doudnabacteria bacterium]|nr:hypothetical protein [Candidatus Doudnabacteria bacterium]
MKKIILAIVFIGLLGEWIHLQDYSTSLPKYLTFSDLNLFANKAVQFGWFYIDKKIEYPVLTGLFVQLSGWLGKTPRGYLAVSSLLLIVFAVVGTYYLWKLAPVEKRKNLWKYWVLAPSMIIFLTYNFDILAVCLVILAMYLIQQKKPMWAVLVLAIGFCAKFYPIIYFPILFLSLTSWRDRVKAVGIFVFFTAIVNVYFMMVNFKFWYFFFAFNNYRPFSSIWAEVMPFLTPPYYTMSMLNAIPIAVFAICYLFLIYRYRKADIFLLFFWATVIFLMFNKVFSPQFLLWLLPFFVLVEKPKNVLFYGFELSNVVLICVVLYYVTMPLPHPGYIGRITNILMIIRHCFLIGILYYSIKQYEERFMLDQNQPRQT